MDPAIHEPEAQFDHTYEPDFDIQDARGTTDWGEYLRQRPYLLIGAAVVGGALLAMALPRSRRPQADGDPRRFAGGALSVPSEMLELWNNSKGALMGLVVSRIRNYIGEMVPDFEEHYRQAEQRATSAGSFGRAHE